MLRCGTGSDVGDNEFLHWLDQEPYNISYLSVSTGWGSNGSWGFNYGESVRHLGFIPKDGMYRSKGIYMN